MNDAPVVKDLVLIGGGHSHVAVLKKFGMLPVPGVRLTLITREVHAPYSGMLPGYLAGHYDFDEAHIDLRPLCNFAGARLFHDTATGLDPEAKRVECAGRPSVAYDVLSINVGSTPGTDIPGVSEYAMPVKPVSAFLERWQDAVERLVSDEEDTLRLVVVGGGAGGVELLLSVQRRLQNLLAERGLSPEHIEFVLVAASERPLATFNSRTSAKFERILAERGIETHFGTRIVRVDADQLHGKDGSTIDYDELIWVTSPSPADWLAETGLELTEDGFLAVDDHLQSCSHEGVFAAGDIATMVSHPRPKSGVFAVRAGPPLAKNLRRSLKDKRLSRWKPQREFLSLIGTGDEYAVGNRSIFSFEGEWVWTLKQWIDTKWMEQWHDLPDMTGLVAQIDPGIPDSTALEKIYETAMRCGGCGAKVGATVLERALGRLERGGREDILVGLDAPDDCAVIEVPDGHVAVQSVDYFRSFIDDPYVFGRIAANHALGDIWAMGAQPQSALAIATIPYASEDKVEETLYQLLAGAISMLDEAGAVLAGGHSSEGAELAFGLEVTGIGVADALLRKSGMRPGDQLILTKPLGTGTLFAADMRKEAKGRWIEAALASMAQPSGEAARIVAEHGATACTDVTGFGLLGHLAEMTRASGVDAALDLAALPVLAGAMETVEAGIFSSLQPENLRLRQSLRNAEAARDSTRYPLIFDPQTAGGLLASVPEQRAAACLQALHGAGYANASIVGRVEERSEGNGSVTTL